MSISRAIEQMSETAVGEQADAWLGIARMLETHQMPPDDADRFPSDAERAAATDWIKTSLHAYEAAHGGEPGRVTVRRLTSAEYAYAIRDLTGVDIKVGIDASSDSVGGEGFANFGDVQSVQDATVERYLEAGRQVADHAVIGSGPLGFYTDPGQTGLELSALNRIQQLYAAHGFRVVSGEGGRPFGFDRYAKAFYVAWHYKHRKALGDGAATLRGLAAPEGITGRFAEHIWSAVNREGAAYPSRLTIDRWRAHPGADVRRPGLGRPGPRRLRRPREGADRVAELAFRARRPRRRRRRRREPARLRRHDAHAHADARVRLSAEPQVRRGRLQGRPRPLESAALGQRAPRQPRRHSRGHLAQPAHRHSQGGPATGARRAGCRDTPPPAGADPEGAGSALAAPGRRSRATRIRHES